MEQQVAEVAGVQCFQPRLIERVEMLALAVGIGLLVGGIEIAGNEAAVLPFVDEAGELACGPAFLVEPFGLEQLLEKAELVVGIEDGEIALQADQFGVSEELGGGGWGEGGCGKV